MITLPNGKICMNEQEAIQWLLDNYPIPFQCSDNYAPDTEIGLGTIVNPTPSKVKVGSIIFFADSKVSTVIAVNANSFKCSEQYNDLVDDVVYVSDVQLNASGHLIVTLSNGDTIDAGLIKQVTGFSINGSQHLIVSYNDGTSTDLGAIFSGNISISGNLSVSGSASANVMTANSIIENMTTQTGSLAIVTDLTIENVFIGSVKNGNKITFAFALNLTRTGAGMVSYNRLVDLNIPSEIGSELYPANVGGVDFLDVKKVYAFKTVAIPIDMTVYLQKISNTQIRLNAYIPDPTQLSLNDKHYLRFESTFLLASNVIIS